MMCPTNSINVSSTSVVTVTTVEDENQETPTAFT